MDEQDVCGHLTLSRYAGESVRIGEDIVVTIQQVKHDGRVVLLVTAPKRVRVLRQELWERTREREE